MWFTKWPMLVMVVLGAFVSYVWAGNREMVEENVKELDELNKDAVRQIPELPSNGVVELEAHVLYQKGQPLFDFTSKRITPEKKQQIQFNEGQKIDFEGTKARK